MINMLNKIYAWLEAATEPATERQIADGVGLKKSPYTKRLLATLIADGHVIRIPGIHANRACYLYTLASRHDGSV